MTLPLGLAQKVQKGDFNWKKQSHDVSDVSI